MKKKLNPVIVILALILICIKVVYVVFLFGHTIQPGGEESIDGLIKSYQDSVNSGDADAYLKLVPSCEKFFAEKAYIGSQINNYSGNDFKMQFLESKSVNARNILTDEIKLFKLSPMRAPLISDKLMVKVKVTDTEDSIVTLQVYKIGNRYFLNDID